ncbi:MAG: DUF2459 domain-containing protein [Shimia sp.]|uniref:DUF2459 domain-containing protein n=1 Tax=Shimia sp. TaxID=1954381 RepID=UPI003B8E4833
MGVLSRFVSFGASDGYDRDTGTPIWIFDHGYHAGLILPRRALKDFGGAHSDVWLTLFPEADWFEFGWGDKGFYFDVPTFADVTFAIGAKALFWPTETVMHVAVGTGSPWTRFTHSEGIEIPVTDMALKKLVSFVEDSVESSQMLGPGLYGVSAFYKGRGKYHLFQTCNSWVSQALRAAGVKSAPAPAVLSSGLMWDLQRRF